MLCPDCGMEHLSSDRNCAYCGSDLADSIVDFKAKRLPISYTGKVRKVPSKVSKRVINFLTSLIVIAIVATSVLYGVYPEIYGYPPLFLFIMIIILLSILFLIFLIPLSIINLRIASEGRASCRTKGPVFSEMELEQKPKKVKKIPSQKTFDILVVFSVLLIVGGLAAVAILSWSGLSEINYIGFIIFTLGFISMIPAAIVRSVIITKGRAFCFSQMYPEPSDYEPSKIEQCLKSFEGCSVGGGSCNFVFLIFLIDLVSILFNKK